MGRLFRVEIELSLSLTLVNQTGSERLLFDAEMMKKFRSDKIQTIRQKLKKVETSIGS